MLITFLLLAVLTIGAVSASDDVASDGLNASDDEDILTIEDSDSLEYDSKDLGIDVNDEICLDDEDDDYDGEVASITLPDSTKNGRFQIRNGEVMVAHLDVSDDEDDWPSDEDDKTIYGTIYLDDFDLTKVHNGDVLTFEFLENIGGNPVDLFTKVYKVISLTSTTMKLSKISGGMEDEDVDLQVKDIDTSKPDENFTYVYVTQKEGFFIISVEGNDDDYDILIENLNTTERPCVKIDKNGTQFYRFGFSFTDVNNYIAQNIIGITSFNDLVDKSIISSGNEIYFGVYEDDEGTDDIYSEDMTFKLIPGRILFKSDEEDVDVDYLISNVIMDEGWQEN